MSDVIPPPGCCTDGSCTSATCMVLPDRKTCGDCAHLRRCTWLLSVEPDSRTCDWFPRKFRLATASGGAALEAGKS